MTAFLGITWDSNVVRFAIGVLLGDGRCRPVQSPGRGDISADCVLDTAVATLSSNASRVAETG